MMATAVGSSSSLLSAALRFRLAGFFADISFLNKLPPLSPSLRVGVTIRSPHEPAGRFGVVMMDVFSKKDGRTTGGPVRVVWK
jgi:hypothetical protein